MKCQQLTLLILSCLLLTACPSNHTMPKGVSWVPEGFAAYDNTKQQAAVSPEGVRYAIRYEKNQPHADLSFWQAAMKKRLLDTGYIFVSDSTIKGSKQSGYLLELSAPAGNQDYIWLIALFVHDKKLQIIEATGEEKLFKLHRAKIVKAMLRL